MQKKHDEVGKLYYFKNFILYDTIIQRIGDNMKNKGFTIVELLAVIVILGIIMGFSIYSISGSSSAAKQKSYETKKHMIENAAVMYAQDNYRSIINDVTSKTEERDGITFVKTNITVDNLLINEEYLQSDTNQADGKVSDPRDNSKFLDECPINIEINTKTKKIIAELEDCNKEK